MSGERLSRADAAVRTAGVAGLSGVALVHLLSLPHKLTDAPLYGRHVRRAGHRLPRNGGAAGGGRPASGPADLGGDGRPGVRGDRRLRGGPVGADAGPRGPHWRVARSCRHRGAHRRGPSGGGLRPRDPSARHGASRARPARRPTKTAAAGLVGVALALGVLPLAAPAVSQAHGGDGEDASGFPSATQPDHQPSRQPEQALAPARRSFVAARCSTRFDRRARGR